MSINPPRTAIPPTVPPAIAPPLEELLLPVGLDGLVVVVVAGRRAVFIVDAVVVELAELVELKLEMKLELELEPELELELVVAEVVNGVRMKSAM
ncbi:hypothetical protein V8E54_008148 [Elaphomyces granulatus]|jgi:hypothetical protein